MARPVGRPRTEPDDRVSTGLRIDRELYDRIQDEAEARDVSTNWFICKLLAESMERLIPVDELVFVRPPDRRSP